MSVEEKSSIELKTVRLCENYIVNPESYYSMSAKPQKSLSVFYSMLVNRMIEVSRSHVRQKYHTPVQVVTALSGAAAVGKTTLCQHLVQYGAEQGFRMTHVELDGFLLPRSQ